MIESGVNRVDSDSIDSKLLQIGNISLASIGESKSAEMVRVDSAKSKVLTGQRKLLALGNRQGLQEEQVHQPLDRKCPKKEGGQNCCDMREVTAERLLSPSVENSQKILGKSQQPRRLKG